METMVMAWWMMVMMIPMKSSVMTMTMAKISPLRISLPESFFSLDGFRPVEAAVFFVDDPPELGFPGGDIRERATWGVDPGGLAIAGRGPTLGRAQVWRGAHLPPPGASFWLAPSSDVLRPPEKVFC